MPELALPKYISANKHRNPSFCRGGSSTISGTISGWAGSMSALVKQVLDGPGRTLVEPE